MVCYYNDNKLVREQVLPAEFSADALPRICFITPAELSAHNEVFQINERLVTECRPSSTTKFESHEGLDFISLRIPDSKNPINTAVHVWIIFRKNLLLFISEAEFESLPVFRRLFSQLGLTDDEPRSFTLERIVQWFFDDLTYEDSLLLEAIEEEASDLEERLITAKGGDYSKEVIALRKKLLAYKRYYDQLSSISASIEENDNTLFSNKEIRYFHIITNRTERLLEGVDNLQDYLSQIREAYQTQIDINQNQTMKLFTVIAAIFMPPTLIVGWYGMNFSMPELKTAWGYPVVAVIVLAVTLFSTLYLKKHKWF